MDKRIDAKSAIGMINDGDVVSVSGFQLCGVATELYHKLRDSFEKTGHPRNLTLIQGAGNLSVHDMTVEGLFGTYITSHFADNKEMIRLSAENKIKAYNFPQGVIAHCHRAYAAGKIGEITKIGLGTFYDPRHGGGKMNEAADEDFVDLIEIMGEEHLLYRLPKVNIAIVRGTSSDEKGNISIENESFPSDMLDIVMSTKSSGGKVICQVKNYITSESMDRTKVLIPGTMVDYVVVCENPIEEHRQTVGTYYDPALVGTCRVRDVKFEEITLDAKKIIARRSAMEMKKGAIVNLGVGIPELVASVASEEGIGDEMVLTVESGMIGGIPAGGIHFGSAYNSWAAMQMCHQFAYYDGGNLDFASLGFAQVDPKGNINVSRFGKKFAGCGGFVDISQSTKCITFCALMTAGGLEIKIDDGKLRIIKEGKIKKFLKDIEEITFSSELAIKNKQEVKFITERCVFELSKEGLVLVEIAPGIDLERDILPVMEFEPVISKNLKEMDLRLFKEGLIGLKDRY